MMNEKKSRLQRYWGVGVFVFLGMILGLYHNLQNRETKPNSPHLEDLTLSRPAKTDLVAGAVRALLSPPAVLLNGFTRWVGQSTNWIFRGYGLANQNRELQKKVEELQAENAKLKEIDLKYQNLRKDLSFVPTLHKPPIACDIVSKRADFNFQTLLLSRGSRDGILKHMVVVNHLGAIGQISEVSPTASVCLLLTDYRSSIGVKVQRTGGKVMGICRGDNKSYLILSELSGEADIKKNDLIISSGVGSVYTPTAISALPHDLIVGKVTEVANDKGTAGKIAFVQPATSVADLEEVYILP